ncbi:hypothetical protein NEOLEDRAFT_1244201 [Neolentinus lepideus HHB14362 ss-1]|uniref:Uncharacterized protein n=1 Tax=Neolentinus lepideus HHB14362 ss-1 TaxID=1314782 RepID=A0A165Q7X3_9AGAM|nr:hypothetical protein NEOLEDRAFT_1244201 [Neolentinus lepideus HHB14362 ss-1]
MFKRVEKRIKKAEQDDELGLDDEVKEALGLNTVDTDSDESDSDSESELASEESANTKKRKRAEDDDGEQDDDNEQDDDEENEQGEDESESDEEDDPNAVPFSMSIVDALSNPTYIQSLDPEIQACIVCPGKLLKHPKMIEVHVASGVHTRRFRRLVEAASQPGVDMNGDPRTLVSTAPLRRPVSAKSKRAEKRTARLVAIEEKRRRQKEAKRKALKRKEQKRKEDAEGAEPSDVHATSFDNGDDFIPLGGDSLTNAKKKGEARPTMERKEKAKAGDGVGHEAENETLKSKPQSKTKKQKVIHERGAAEKPKAKGEGAEPLKKKVKVDVGGERKEAGKRQGEKKKRVLKKVQ